MVSLLLLCLAGNASALILREEPPSGFDSMGSDGTYQAALGISSYYGDEDSSALDTISYEMRRAIRKIKYHMKRIIQRVLQEKSEEEKEREEAVRKVKHKIAMAEASKHIQREQEERSYFGFRLTTLLTCGVVMFLVMYRKGELFSFLND